jgi:Zn-dependent protease with chaperone function
MSRRIDWLSRRTLALLAVLGTGTGCVAPNTQLGAVSPELVRAEQLRQRQLVIESGIAEQQRLENIAYSMLKAAVPLCGDRITTRSGLMVANLHSYERDYHEAARALGFTDTLMVVGIAKGSAAERAGLTTGDRIVGVREDDAPTGRNAVRNFLARIAPPRAKRGQPALAVAPLRFMVQRSSAPTAATKNDAVTIDVAEDTVCAYGAVAIKDDVLNAWADGKQVVLTTAMMRFAGSDEELAAIVGHEIAHNAMRHIDAKKTNSAIGAIFGAILDVAAASQGVNTGGEFTNQGASIGAMTYSQDFEREADYVGLYIVARSGRPVASAPNFWRRMAQESPGSIAYASSHPTSAERFIRLEQAAAEIAEKQANGLPLMPEAKAPTDKSP